MRNSILIVCILFLISCKKEANSSIEKNSIPNEIPKNTEILQLDSFPKTEEKTIIVTKIDSSFININSVSSDFILDLKYATTDNFLKQKVYDCPDCYLRKNTALALMKANQELIKKGFRIKLFDCYRPLDVQKKMWEILPGTQYIANPKKGSKHNRGAAVDLTLVDSLGNELDMGTKFDFFGPEAHHTYTKHSKEVSANRKLLKETLAKYNFKSIYNEWWHYEYRPERHSNVSNFKWKCE